MPDKVMEFVVASGGGTVDEIIARVEEGPENIVASLDELLKRRFVEVTGPKSVEDFRELVADVQRKKGTLYDDGDELRQAAYVLEEIVKRRPEFLKMSVYLTTRGLTFGPH